MNTETIDDLMEKMIFLFKFIIDTHMNLFKPFKQFKQICWISYLFLWNYDNNFCERSSFHWKLSRQLRHC